MNWNERVFSVVEKIPYGRVASYGQIAKMLGKPRGAREVGWAMRHCPEGLPWHRVVRTDGSIACPGNSDIGEMRMSLLEGEGVLIADGKIDMGRFQWFG
jgi:methylated-DNA-protein-cysteine methyltransferase-like protein